VWSADGRRIAFESLRDGNAEVYVMNADGSGQMRLSRNEAYDGDLAWSPDGTKIAFETDRDGDFELFVMNADGTGVTRLTGNRTGDTSPAWSPDGARILFARTVGDDFELFVMNADGSEQRRVTKLRGPDIFPAWAPDGRALPSWERSKSKSRRASGRRGSRGTGCGMSFPPGRRTGQKSCSSARARRITISTS